jgi:hypothetical protein
MHGDDAQAVARCMTLSFPQPEVQLLAEVGDPAVSMGRCLQAASSTHPVISVSHRFTDDLL